MYHTKYRKHCSKDHYREDDYYHDDHYGHDHHGYGYGHSKRSADVDSLEERTFDDKCEREGSIELLERADVEIQERADAESRVSNLLTLPFKIFCTFWFCEKNEENMALA